MIVNKVIKKVVAVVLSCIILINMVACGSSMGNENTSTSFERNIQAENLVSDVEKQHIDGKVPDEKFINSQLDFYVDIFKNSVKIGENKNILISPLSIMLALSMTANGAAGETKEAMEDVLAGGITVEELNEYLYKYVETLSSNEKSKLSLANSIWTLDKFNVKESFIQTNVNYYKADMYKVAFDDNSIKDINNWVKQNTDGMIEKIIEKHADGAVMYLINALAFDAKWEEVYKPEDIKNGRFTSYEGRENKVKYMYSKEDIYINDEDTIGFIKHYKDNQYSFVALLPDEDIDILEYIDGFTYEKYISLMEGKENCKVNAILPEFSYEYGHSMKDVLKNMGMSLAFDFKLADFSNLADGALCIDDVIHKTFIQVDANGTRAGAATKVGIVKSAISIEENKIVRLDRPFVYMIIDNVTNLPIFMGVTMEIEN